MLGLLFSNMYMNALYYYILPDTCILYIDDRSIVCIHRQYDILFEGMSSLEEKVYVINLNNDKIQRFIV